MRTFEVPKSDPASVATLSRGAIREWPPTRFQKARTGEISSPEGRMARWRSPSLGSFANAAESSRPPRGSFPSLPVSGVVSTNLRRPEGVSARSRTGGRGTALDHAGGCLPVGTAPSPSGPIASFARAPTSRWARVDHEGTSGRENGPRTLHPARADEPIVVTGLRPGRPAWGRGAREPSFALRRRKVRWFSEEHDGVAQAKDRLLRIEPRGEGTPNPGRFSEPGQRLARTIRPIARAVPVRAFG